jgi:hypothetical protein
MTNDHESLFADALSGSLDRAGKSTLADLISRDPDARRDLARQIAVHAWLRTVRGKPIDADVVMRALPIRERTANAVMRRVRTQRRRKTSWQPRIVWISAAAALIAIACIVGVQSLGSREALDHITLTASEGDVTGDTVTGFTLGGNGRVVLVAGDKAKATLKGPAKLHIPKQGGADGLTFALGSGTLTIDAPPRSGGRPLTITTPAANLLVIGTQFTVHANESGTNLAVVHGSVRFQPLRGVERVVSGGERADALKPGAVVRVPASADAMIDDSMPDQNIRGDKITVHGKEPVRAACLRFQLPTQDVRSATLILTKLSGTGVVTVYQTAGAWNESTLTWHRIPARGALIGTLIAGSDGRYRLDVTSACKSGVCDITLYSNEMEFTFASREADSGKPELETTW